MGESQELGKPTETLADIVRAMRGRAEDGRVDGAPWAWYAERIEAAWKRERARLMAESRSWEECIKRAEESWDDVY